VPQYPAAGSAAATFGVALAYDRPPQGFEMGRPSRIVLGFDVQDDPLRSASIVIVSTGALDL
jgi:hypothetical protein